MFAVILVGLLVNLGIFNNALHLGAFMYYTILSNLLALILFGLLIYKTIRDLSTKGSKGSAGYLARFEFVCTVDLLLTFAVYWVLLAPQLFSMGENYSMWSFDNLSVHLIAPLGCLLDYILFAKSKRLKYRDVYLTLIFPFVYLVSTSIAGSLGYVYLISAADGLPVHFPYPFMDYDRVSLLSADLHIFVIMIAIIVVGHVFYFLNRKQKKRKAKKSPHHN